MIHLHLLRFEAIQVGSTHQILSSNIALLCLGQVGVEILALKKLHHLFAFKHPLRLGKRGKHHQDRNDKYPDHVRHSMSSPERRRPPEAEISLAPHDVWQPWKATGIPSRMRVG